MFDDESPVVLVTGSSSARVGRCVVSHFLSNGYRAVVHANHSIGAGQSFVADCERTGLTAMLVQGDISDEATVIDWIDSIDKRFGRLDAVVHCAATWDRKPLESTTADDVLKNVRTHTLGTFLVAQQAGLRMVQQSSGGSIVLIGDWALERPYVDFAAYFSGKGSVPTMTRSFAVELGSRNPRVRVNCILPGTVLLSEDASQSKQQTLRQATLVKRLGTPDDIAQAALFLCDSPFITGVSLPVDGGRHCYAGDNVDAVAHPEHP